MTEEVKNLIIYEKKLSFALKFLYAGELFFFCVAVIALFTFPHMNHSIFLIVFLSKLLLFFIFLYSLIMKLLKTHRKIADSCQQEFDLKDVPSFEACKEYFQNAGFLVYEEDGLMIANKLLLQGHKGLIKRDYLVQVLATSKEIPLETYMETHQKGMDKYLADFQKKLEVTKNKIITVGTFVHYVKEMPEELAQEFKVQSQQRYLIRFDVIIDEENKKLYYPSHVETYKDRQWCGQLLPEPYNEIASFVHKVYL